MKQFGISGARDLCLRLRLTGSLFASFSRRVCLFGLDLSCLNIPPQSCKRGIHYLCDRLFRLRGGLDLLDVYTITSESAEGIQRRCGSGRTLLRCVSSRRSDTIITPRTSNLSTTIAPCSISVCIIYGEGSQTLPFLDTRMTLVMK